MDVEDVMEMRHHLRLVRMQEGLLGLIAEFNACHADLGRCTGIEVTVDDKGNGEVQFMDGSYPIVGESL